MKLAAPQALYLVWLVPVMALLLWWGLRSRRKILGRFARRETLTRIVRTADGHQRLAGSILVLSAFVLMTLAVAGPLYGYRWRTVERRGVDIMMVLDVSRSMLAEDVKPNRLARAKREIIDFLNRLEGDRVGLVAFAGTAFLQCPLTVDYAGFHLFLNALGPDFLPVGGSALAEAIDTALKGFDPKSPAEKVIIVLTDGQPTLGDPFDAADRAREAGVVIHGVGVGTGQGAPIPEAGGGFKKDAAGNIVLTKLEEVTIRKVVARTGGVYVPATLDDTDWDVIYDREIRGKMEARTLEDSRTRVWENRYQWPLGLALILLVAEFVLYGGRKRTRGIVLCLVLGVFGANGVEASGAPGQVREGIRHYEAGDYESAVNAFVRAQVEEPGVAELSYDSGSAQYKKGDYEAALRNFEAASQSEDTDLKARSLFNLGNTQYRLGRFEDSVKSYEQVLELNPRDEEARKNLEFVKKRIEERNQEASQEERPENRREGEEKKDDPSAQKGEPSGEGREEDRDQEADVKPESRERKETNQAEKAEDGGKQEKDQGVAEGRQEPGRSMDPAREERMLNRLEDRPGRALLPVYSKRQVEKDW